MIALAELEERLAQKAEKDAEIRAASEVSLTDEQDMFTTRLSATIDRAWQRNRDNKTSVEMNMLECLRERKGEYGPEELAMIHTMGGSDIYIKEATGKIRAGVAHIKAVLIPTGSAKAHGVKPTPVVDIPKFMEDRIVQRITDNPNMVDQEGNPVALEDQLDSLLAMAQREAETFSEKAAQGMERKIEDQLTEGGYYKALSQFIEDFCTYPAAFMKGPYFSNEPTLKYEYQEEGSTPVTGYETKMKFKAINPFDAYPAPAVDSVQKGDFFERLRMTKRELYRMRDMPGYNKEAIKEVMSESDNGKLDHWLWTDAQRDRIAEHNLHWYNSTSELDGLHWYGSAQGVDLIEWGMNPKLIDDPLDYYEVDAIKVGRNVVKATLNADPKYRRCVHSAAYERVAGSVFGNSVSMLMRSTQRMINATARALQNNQAHTSGFQIEVNHRRLAPESDPHDIHPFKVWQTEESEVATNGAQAIRFFQPSSNAQEYMGTLTYFKQIADSDTGIPSVLQGAIPGSDGAAGTAKGQGYLLSNSAKLLRYSIGNIDEDVVVPMLEMMFDHNMLYDPDPSIKWDSQIVARGANELLQRESARSEHMAVLEITNNPTDGQLIGLRGRAHLLSKTLETFENIDATQVLPTGEELKQKLAEIENTPPPPDPNIVKIEANTQIEQGKLELATAKLEMEENMHRETLAAQRIIETMRNATKEKISEDDLQLKVQNEVVKLRATRMSERERLQLDVAKVKLNAEHELRLRKFDLDNQPDQMEIEAAVAKAIEPLAARLGKQLDQVSTKLTQALKTAS